MARDTIYSSDENVLDTILRGYKPPWHFCVADSTGAPLGHYGTKSRKASPTLERFRAAVPPPSLLHRGREVSESSRAGVAPFL